MNGEEKRRNRSVVICNYCMFNYVLLVKLQDLLVLNITNITPIFNLILLFTKQLFKSVNMYLVYK